MKAHSRIYQREGPQVHSLVVGLVRLEQVALLVEQLWEWELREA